jgi:hypothetical protein
MSSTEEIYKIMNEEFMGHKVDGVIIAKPYEITSSDKIWREYANYLLEREVNE